MSGSGVEQRPPGEKLALPGNSVASLATRGGAGGGSLAPAAGQLAAPCHCHVRPFRRWRQGEWPKESYAHRTSEEERIRG